MFYHLFCCLSIAMSFIFFVKLNNDINQTTVYCHILFFVYCTRRL